MDLMILMSELTYMIVVLVTRPFVLSISASLFCLKTAVIGVCMFADMVNTAISFHVSLFWRAVIGTVSLMLLPVRFLAAIPRERLLEQSLIEMQFELETVALNKRELEENLKVAMKEFRAMELELTELEEERDKAIYKVEILEAELKDLKEENLRLKEINGKAYWSSKGHADLDTAKNMASADNYGISYGIPAWKLQDMLMTKDPSDKKKKGSLDLQSRRLATCSPVYGYKDNIAPEISDIVEVLGHRRGVALSQSIFSALLSLLVGIIVWESKEPCMPLVGALFTVVGISLKSVVLFFSTIKNKPASDAVALLSLNCFILGTLTYPTLPKIARVLAPPVSRIMDRVVHWLGIALR